MPENSFESDQTNQSGSADEAKRFKRTRDLYGVKAFAKIRASRVAVIGQGGVGSHAALALARSGVGELLLVDFDRVTASSLNRSPFAGPRDIPDTICQATAVASEISDLLKKDMEKEPAAATDSTRNEIPDITDEEPAIGIFICKCGGEVSDYKADL